MKYPRIKIYDNNYDSVLICMILNEKGEETLDWYNIDDIKQILKEQKEEEEI